MFLGAASRVIRESFTGRADMVGVSGRDSVCLGACRVRGMEWDEVDGVVGLVASEWWENVEVCYGVG